MIFQTSMIMFQPLIFQIAKVDVFLFQPTIFNTGGQS